MMPMLKNGENTLKSKDGKAGYDLTPFKDSSSHSPLKAVIASLGKYSPDIEEKADAAMTAGGVEELVKQTKGADKTDKTEEMDEQEGSPSHNEKVAEILRSLADMLCPEPEDKGLMIDIMIGKGNDSPKY